MSERPVALLLGASALASAGFVVAFVAGGSTQLLGLSLGLALLFLAAAAILAGAGLAPSADAVDDRPPLEDSDAVRSTGAELRRGTEGLSRRRLLAGGAAAAGTVLGAALVVPAASLGPSPGERIGSSPWRRGRRVVDDRGARYRAAEIEVGTFVTGFPEGADPRELGAAVVIVKLDPEELDPPAGREGWAPGGVLAFSKICTHAGCAISLYRYPLFPPTSPRPALVCPCHYSTFDPATGGERIFGPAGRALPQLPLELDPDGGLVAAGDFSGPVGPAWSGVRSQDS